MAENALDRPLAPDPGSAIVFVEASPLALASQVADRAAAAHVFAEYQRRKSPQTLRRQRADLALFTSYLEAAGVPVGDLAADPGAWAGLSWGVVSGFVAWQLGQGYAIGSINVRLATVKGYSKLALQAGAISPEAYAMIRTVGGYRHAEGRHVDEGRKQTRVGKKKAEAVSITPELAARLKRQPNTPQGRRDALMMCLLLDHGLRVGELAGLRVEHLQLRAGSFTFYRSKVDKTQTHRMTEDTRAAARAYLKHDAPTAPGPLLLGSRKGGQLEGAMRPRAITARVAALGARAGVEGLSAHDCRHAWATAAMRAGTDIKALQDAGGWASPAMPLRYAESARIANEGVKLK